MFYGTSVTSDECLGAAPSPGHDGDEPGPSQSGLGRWKLLLFETLVKHYGHVDRPPLLPQHLTHVYTAITDLLGDWVPLISAQNDKGSQIYGPNCKVTLVR